MRYEFKLFDLTIDKIDEQLDCFIDLNEDNIHYRLEAYINKTPIISQDGEEEESFDDREGVYTYEEVVYKREFLGGVQICSIDVEDTNIWSVDLLFSEVGSVIKIRFDKEPEATKFFKLVNSYLLGSESKKRSVKKNNKDAN